MAMSDVNIFKSLGRPGWQDAALWCLTVLSVGQQPSEITSRRTLQTFLKEQAYQHVPERARQAPFE